MLCPIGEIFEIFLGSACLSVKSIPIYRYKSVLKGDSGPSDWKSAEVSLRACWLLDLVGLAEDCGGPNLHDNGVGPWLHGVVAQLLLLAVNQDGHDAALN